MHAPRRHVRLGAREVIAAGLLIAVLAPAALYAQRGAGGFGGRGVGKLAREPGLEVPKQVNAINLLIEHRPELGLSDSVFARVIVLKRSLDSTNAPTMRRLDSLARLFRGGLPIFSDPSPARRDSLAEAKGLMRELTAVIHDNISSARDKAYGLLDEQQLVRAQAIEAKAEKAIEDEGKKKP